MQTINLKHLSGISQINVGCNLIADSSISTACADLGDNFVIVTDTNLVDLYAMPIAQQLDDMGKDCNLITIPPGESSKTRETKEKIEDAMLADNCGRDTILIAIGGGVVTDIAGFVAATYCRGIKSIYVPTTLLAMVDAAIGGKTAVNTEFGKNLIGSFYQPNMVFCDVTVLDTLSHDEVANGLVETIKHALIIDVKLFNSLDILLDEFQKGARIGPQQLNDIVYASCNIKADVVMQDECEQGGIRQLLNFGHTIGHAIERELQYKVSHGQAVLAGLWMASFMSYKLGHLTKEDFDIIIKTLDKIKYSTKLKLTDAEINNLTAHMKLDKKAVGKEARFVLLQAIGCAYVHDNNYSFPVDTDIVDAAIKAWSEV